MGIVTNWMRAMGVEWVAGCPTVLRQWPQVPRQPGNGQAGEPTPLPPSLTHSLGLGLRVAIVS